MRGQPVHVAREFVVFGTGFHKFLRDESGGYTIWSLIWFSLYVAMGGLAVDVTDAYRNQTLLQSTADAAALAGVMSLPIKDDVEAQALNYAANNMTPAINGWVLKASDVTLGNWDSTTGKFIPGETAPDAVRVVTQRSDENLNPLATNFLRILGLWGLPFDRWNIRTEAVALRYIPNCVRDGFIARNQVDFNGNNFFFNEICIHGQNMDDDPGLNYAVDIGMGNEFESTVQVSMPDLTDLNGKPNVCTNNYGLCEPGVLVAGDLWPKDIDDLDTIIAGLQNADPDYVLSAVFETDTATGASLNPTVLTRDENFEGPYLPYHIYDVNCSNGKKTLNLPTGVLIENVVIVADCKIKASSGVMLVGVVLASSAVGNGQDPLNQNSIDLSSDAQIGTSAFCDDNSGQVHIYAAASVHVAAGPTVYGLRAVVGGNFHLTANNDVNGISVQAGNNITSTANGEFGFCGGVFAGPFAWHYRLVR